jgi:Fucosyltransferase, N-terminal
MSATNITRKTLAIFTKFRSRRIFFYPFVILLFYFFYHAQVQSIQQHQISTTTAAPQKRKRILFWTKYFGIDHFHVGFGQKPFQHCPVSNCETTKRRNLLSASDAVVFHPMDLWSKDLPRSRPPDQRWIFFLLESPQAWGLKIKKPLADQFNWTMTYR